jgi:hypothetical protein
MKVGKGCFEGHPDENEASIIILAAGLRTTDPTDGSMGTQSHRFGKPFENGELFSFQGCMVETISHF